MYKCGAAADTLKSCQSDKSAKTNMCYCTGSSSGGCQNVSACKCAGTAMTKYANKDENAKANNGAGSMAKVAGTTMAAAAIAWWLL